MTATRDKTIQSPGDNSRHGLREDRARPVYRELLSGLARRARACGFRGLADDASWFANRARLQGLIAATAGLATRITARRRLRLAIGRPKEKEMEVWALPPQASHSIAIRTGESDLHVYAQIFVEDEYFPIGQDDIRGLIIDCGANVGYSSVWFLSRWPGCRVLAIEPDPDNFRQLSRNLKPYGDRAHAIHGGVWNSTGRLTISSHTYRGGGAWARQVLPAKEGDFGAIEAYDIQTLMKKCGVSRVALLKVDIEGAEAVVFDESCHKWLSQVDRIAVELHDDTVYGDSSSIFFDSIAQHEFVCERSGELVICRHSRSRHEA